MDGGTCHEFFVADTGRNRILYVNEWQCSDNTGSVCWDVAIAGSGVNTGRQLSIVRRSDTSANRLLVSKSSGFDERAFENGEVLREVSGFRDTTGAVRVLHRASDSGLLWFARSSSIFAVDRDCTEHWSTTLPDGAQAHHVLPRSGGGFYATIVSPPAVVEYDAQGELVLNLAASEAEHPSEVVAYSSLARLENGNFLVAIVLDGGSEPAAEVPQLVELTPENDVVWKWENQILGRAGGLAVVR